MSTFARRLTRVGPHLRLLVRRVGAVLFAGSDAHATLCRWTIVERWGGLARTYRDPRFDQYEKCYRCHGTGINHTFGSGPCFRCAGTGRLTAATRWPAPVEQQAS